MAETTNIAEIAAKISNEIFQVFLWNIHPARDINFNCINSAHLTANSKEKKTHPCDVVFYYKNPYADEIVYLNTDLKSYTKDTLTHTRIRNSLKSLGMTVSCAMRSAEWKNQFSTPEFKNIKIKGMLFLFNHDNTCTDDDFKKQLNKINFSNLNLDRSVYLYLLGPSNILNLHSVAGYIDRYMKNREYTFYYPDLCLSRRNGSDWNQAATLDSLLSPFFILKYKNEANSADNGYYVFYNELGQSKDEFIYLIDAFSQYQMLENNNGEIKVILTNKNKCSNWKSNFTSAINTYKHMWQLNKERSQLLNSISFDTVSQLTTSFIESDLGWRV